MLRSSVACRISCHSKIFILNSENSDKVKNINQTLIAQLLEQFFKFSVTSHSGALFAHE